MKLSALLSMMVAKMVAKASGLSEPKPMRRKLSQDWELPDKPVWAGFLTGKVIKGSYGVPVPSQRPVWRAKYIGDRSKYKPHQGPRECARRVRQGLA